MSKAIPLATYVLTVISYNRDYRISNCATCGTVDLGTTATEMEALGFEDLVADLDQVVRPQGPAYDIGAYEHNRKSLVDIGIWLEGAYDLTTNLMRDDLDRLQLVPLIDPFVGTHLLNPDLLGWTGNDALIDWLWVELRDDDNNLALVASSPSVLLADGRIVDKNGRSFYFEQSFPIGYYRLLVHHRNHLPALSDVSAHFDNDEDIAYFDFDCRIVIMLVVLAKNS